MWKSDIKKLTLEINDSEAAVRGIKIMNIFKLVFRNFITYKRLLSSKEIVVDPNFFEVPF